MATGAPPADQTADLLQNLSLDSQATLTQPAIKASFNTADAGQIRPYERSMTPILPDSMDQSTCYLPNGYPPTAYYYGGYEGMIGEWDDYSRYLNPDGSEMPSGAYGDNGSLLYHGYGYGPYSLYPPPGSPVPTMGHDSSLYGSQQYQYPTPYFQPPLNPSSGPYNPAPTAQPRLEPSTSAPAERDPLSVETANGNPNDGVLKGNNGSVAAVPHQNLPFNSSGSYGRNTLPGGAFPSGFQDPRYTFDGALSPIPWVDGQLFPDMLPRSATNTSMSPSTSNMNNTTSRNQSLYPHSNLVGIQHPSSMPTYMNHGYVNRMYPSKMYGQCEIPLRPGFSYDSQTDSRRWLGMDKYKTRGRNNGFLGYGNENNDGLNELNRGPRAKATKNPKGAVDSEEENSSADNELYNRPDFPVEYNDAMFFIIKSYSEDNVHKSVKYNVWASTPNGNKKLDAAYHEARNKPGGCPLFLLFSVNTSGQFVGLAEMVGPVDFQKNMEYWQQDKWNGCFPVKWHIVKDIPNSLLKHIILENNENKPVTNSRDTQEVKLEQGLQMIKIFKDFFSRTSILDDFGFYEARQKTLQERKAKQQQFAKQVWEGKASDDRSKDGELKSGESSSQAIPGEGGAISVVESFSVSRSGDDSNPITVPEKRILQNGNSNGS